MSQIRWMPLESNPEVMNQFLWKLGVSPKFQFNDVFGLDDDLLCIVPQPCLAVILLFPVSTKYVEFSKDEAGKIEKSGQKLSKNLFFMKQTIGNACGAIGVIHAVANIKNKLEFLSESVFEKFYSEATSLSPLEKGKMLENNLSISKLHEDCAREGQSAVVDANEKVYLHFVALVQVDGSIYEFDGNKDFPINHGPSSAETFLKDAAKVCKQFMARDQTELRFTIVALSEM